MVTFIETKRKATAFTKKTYDPSEAANTECTVRFDPDLPTITQVGPDAFDVECEFLEVVP